MSLGAAILLGASIAVLVSMVLALFRALAGPSVFDRILAANMFGTKTVLLLALLGFVAGRPAFMDIALAYALINFIGTVALMKFFRYRQLGLGARDDLSEM